MENEVKKKAWRRGIEMPEFSGKSWKELNDIWPFDKRVSSDAYYIIAVVTPAFHIIGDFSKKLLGKNKSISMREIFLLAWVSRCEEAKEGLCTEWYPVSKGIGHGLKAFYARKANLTKLGLIENIPTNEAGLNFKAYRVTEKGRLLLRKFVEAIEESHDLLKTFWSKDQPEFADNKPIDLWIKLNTGEATAASEP